MLISLSILMYISTYVTFSWRCSPMCLSWCLFCNCAYGHRIFDGGWMAEVYYSILAYRGRIDDPYLIRRNNTCRKKKNSQLDSD